MFKFAETEDWTVHKFQVQFDIISIDKDYIMRSYLPPKICHVISCTTKQNDNHCLPSYTSSYTHIFYAGLFLKGYE